MWPGRPWRARQAIQLCARLPALAGLGAGLQALSHRNAAPNGRSAARACESAVAGRTCIGLQAPFDSRQPKESPSDTRSALSVFRFHFYFYRALRSWRLTKRRSLGTLRLDWRQLGWQAPRPQQPPSWQQELLPQPAPPASAAPASTRMLRRVLHRWVLAWLAPCSKRPRRA